MSKSNVFSLSGRELQVLGLLIKGYTNRQIADALAISENTVERHLTAIFGKLGVPNRTAAAIQALKGGLPAMSGNSGNP